MTKQREFESTIVDSSFALTTDSAVIENDNLGKVAFVTSITDDDPSDQNFTDNEVSVANDTVTITSHGYLTGLKVQLTTDGSLPTGLSTGTDYYIIKVDDNTIAFASSVANAQADTRVDITALAGGSPVATNTVSATALSGSVDIQASLDNSTYVQVDSTSNNFNDSANFLWNIVDPAYRYIKVTHTITAGQITVETKGIGWSE